jgi:DNA-binding CsgD family transcriptional regulator/tetratricopeptide (TPR) repeat protein
LVGRGCGSRLTAGDHGWRVAVLVAMLRDRRDERQALDDLVKAVCSGRSAALVVRGEAGVGKSALLNYLIAQAAGCRVAPASGVQSEMELAFGGLHRLCAPLLDRLEQLPEPQQKALRTAFGLVTGSPPDRFLIGLAVLSLLAEVAVERPLICVIDDAQWLDSASVQAIAFAARRMLAESVAVVFAVRDPHGTVDFEGLPELVVEGLPEDAARALLNSALRGPADPRIVDRIVAEARGNPLALLELPRGLTATQLASGFGLPSSSSLPARIEESFHRQLAPLPAHTRQLLIITAAEPIGDPVLTWRAAERLGIDINAATPAQASGLVDFGARVEFRHPLVRSAIYRAASPDQLRRAHAALAEATDPLVDPDRRAWHAAQATSGPDEAVAADLERSADRAQSRGGMAAAAAFMERAAELTLDPARRPQRALAAARAHHCAGSPNAALRLLSLAEAGHSDDAGRAHVDLLRAQIVFTMNRGSDAPPMLLKAAKQLEPFDIRLARETYLDALLAAMFAGGLAIGGSVREVAEAARTAPAPDQPGRPADLLLDGLAVRFTDGYAAAVPMLKQALTAFRDMDLTPKSLRWFWLAHITAGNLWDEQTLDNARHLQLARDMGAMATLPLALTVRIGAHVLSGDLGAAGSLVDELDAVTDATGIPPAPYGALLLAAWQGHERQAFNVIEKATAQALRRGEGFGLITTGTATALVCNSLSRYGAALEAASKASKYPPIMGVESWGVLVELVEAAVRVGQRHRAVDAYARITETTQATRTDWALGIEARCRALLSQGQAADTAYREAVDRLSRTRIRGELARAHLLYGEWLRRRNHRVKAREQLRTSHQMFTTMGMDAFADRAAGELRATGETVRKRTVDTASQLTAQESQIARLVGEGLSNTEIAARLFLSPRTVEWHLSKVFAKLQITSRRQLRR